jgi:ribosomal protein S27AE
MTMHGRKVDAGFRWPKAKQLDDLMVDTHSTKHGARHLGTQNIMDVPKDVDVTKIMPLPWICPKCGNGHLMYVFNCNRCGLPTPLGEENWRA